MKAIRIIGAVSALLPAALFAGTITGKVHVQGGDTAIADARVILRQGQTALDTVITGADGLYTFSDIDSGRYTLAANKTGYQNGSGSAFVNGADSTATVNIAMTLIPPPGWVRGVVTDTVNNKAAAGARVILSRGNGGTAFRDTVLTDAEGKFGFDSVAANSGYSLAVSLAGYVSRTLTNQTVPGGDTLKATVGIAPVPPPGWVRGVVTDTVNSKAVANALVVLVRGNGGTAVRDSAKTDAEGKFGFDSVAANSGYSLAVSLAGYVSRTLTNQTVPGGDTLKVTVGIAPIPAPGWVRGVVTDTVNSKPVANARVILSRFGGGSFNDTATTNAEGRFGFDSVPANTGYSIAVTATGFANRTLNNQVVPAADTLKVTVGIAPIAYGTLSIFAADSADSAALKGASVLARLNNGTTLTGTTGDNGWAHFDKVEPGNYTVTVSIAGYVAKAATRQVTEADQDTGKVYLSKVTDQNSKALTGTVKDSSGQAVEGATVVVVVSAGGQGGGQTGVRLQTTTSATGEYSFAGIPASAASVTLTVTKSGFATATATVTLAAGSTTHPVTLRPPTVTVRNALKLRPALRPLSGAWLMPQGSLHRLVNGRAAPGR